MEWLLWATERIYATFLWWCSPCHEQRAGEGKTEALARGGGSLALRDTRVLVMREFVGRQQRESVLFSYGGLHHQHFILTQGEKYFMTNLSDYYYFFPQGLKRGYVLCL